MGQGRVEELVQILGSGIDLDGRHVLVRLQLRSGRRPHRCSQVRPTGRKVARVLVVLLVPLFAAQEDARSQVAVELEILPAVRQHVLLLKQIGDNLLGGEALMVALLWMSDRGKSKDGVPVLVVWHQIRANLQHGRIQDAVVPQGSGASGDALCQEPIDVHKVRVFEVQVLLAHPVDCLVIHHWREVHNVAGVERGEDAVVRLHDAA
mmetsp:Transcript_36247/g.103590  ORF Transcript_36247/g.103590 Transcript_36247/m.103590 type:complete len:207 (-) Transcript_36247:603-1223(-)